MEIFEIASRNKVRFKTPQGDLTVEDLWGLPMKHHRPNVANLYDIAVALSREITPVAAGSAEIDALLGSATVTRDNRLTQVKFEVVKRVIQYKMEREAAAKTREANAARAEQIKRIIADKQDEALKNLPPEELQKLLQGMNGSTAETDL